jgi:hypothetical protein
MATRRLVRPTPRTNERPRDLESSAGVTDAGQRGASDQRSRETTAQAPRAQADDLPATVAEALRAYTAAEEAALDAVRRLGRAHRELHSISLSTLPPRLVSATLQRLLSAVESGLGPAPKWMRRRLVCAASGPEEVQG